MLSPNGNLNVPPFFPNAFNYVLKKMKVLKKLNNFVEFVHWHYFRAVGVDTSIVAELNSKHWRNYGRLYLHVVDKWKPMKMSFLSIRFSLPFLIVTVSFFNGLLTLLKTVIKILPTPYIDEIFHIPQAQRYCRNEFDKWDSKITTLPGLYFVSLALLKPLEAALGLSLCSVYGLRFVNVLGTLLNFVLCYGIQQKLTPLKVEKGTYIDVMSAVNVAAFPPLFFFSFLYYTDVWSTSFVLLMYFIHLSESQFFAAVAGIGAILMRQTNVIWVGLLLIDSGWTALVGKKKKNAATVKEAVHLGSEALKQPFFFRILQATWPYLIVCIFFITFVVANGGVVVGDKLSHVAVLHPMQNLYFIVFAAFFAFPYAIFELGGLYRSQWKFPLLCTLWVACALLSEYNLLEHPYLLADNRHLFFYIWRRSFGHRAIRRLLSPVYVLSGLIIFRLLRNVNVVFLVSLVLCTVANLTPQYLFEVRYFIVPYVLARLNFPQKKPAILLETIFFAAVNAVVFYIFVTKQFYWQSEPRVIQRIIW